MTDAALMFNAYAQDAAVTRFLAWWPHTDLAETRAVIDRFLATGDKGEEFCWLIFRNDTGDMIGSIAALAEENGFNLGFLLARSHWGHGYMPEAIGAVVDWALTQPWVSRISAACGHRKSCFCSSAPESGVRSRRDSAAIFSSP